RLAPESPQAYLLMGQIHAQRGSQKAAREMFAKAAEVDATYVPARLALGRLDYAGKNIEGAVKEFDAAVQANPKSLEAVRDKAAGRNSENRVKEAVQFVKSSVKANDRDASFHTILGNLYQLDGQNDKAAGSFRRALELDPGAVGARLGLARLALGQQR